MCAGVSLSRVFVAGPGAGKQTVRIQGGIRAPVLWFAAQLPTCWGPGTKSQERHPGFLPCADHLLPANLPISRTLEVNLGLVMWDAAGSWQVSACPKLLGLIILPEVMCGCGFFFSFFLPFFFNLQT